MTSPDAESADDPWPDEPDDPGEVEEPDPAEDIGPEVPEASIPGAPNIPDPSENEVPDDLARTFWKLVMIFNVALLAVSLGPMLVFFRGQWVVGGAVFVLGVAFFVRGYLGYRQHTRDE